MEHRARLDAPGDDGIPIRAHLKQLWITKGKKPEELRERPVPAVALHLWDWFWSDLGPQIGSDGSLIPLSYAEIDAWARLRDIDLEPWEVAALRAMDRTRRAAMMGNRQ